MPVYKFALDLPRRITPAEEEQLNAVLVATWHGMRRTAERDADLAKTIHARHLERIEVWATHPEGHPRAGGQVHDVDAQAPHLFCADCGRTLVGYGSGGGLACPLVADHPAAAETACDPACVVECGIRPSTEGVR